MNSPIVFVVDDDASVRTAVRRLLLSVRLPVRLFASAEHFIASTDRGACGCLILDERLPGMTGLQLQEKLIDADWRLPVIFISAHDGEHVRDTAIRRGAIAYLRKPFDSGELLTNVYCALGRAAV